jgi:hypothetical protein
MSQTPLVAKEPVVLDQPAEADTPLEAAIRRGLQEAAPSAATA